MKRILSLLTLCVALAALAEPTFQTLPGTPAELVTNAATNQSAVIVPPPAVGKTSAPAKYPGLEMAPTAPKPSVPAEPVAPVQTPVVEKVPVVQTSSVPEQAAGTAQVPVPVKPVAPPRQPPQAGVDPQFGFSVIKPEKAKPAKSATKPAATTTNDTPHIIHAPRRSASTAPPSGTPSDPIVMGAAPASATASTVAAPTAATAPLPVAPPASEPATPAVVPAPEAAKIPAPAPAETATQPVTSVVTETPAAVAPPAPQIPVPSIPTPEAAVKVQPKAGPPAPTVVAPVVVIPPPVVIPPAPTTAAPTAVVPPAAIVPAIPVPRIPPAGGVPPLNGRIPGAVYPTTANSLGGSNAARTAGSSAPSARITAENANEIIPAGMIRFQAAPLEQVLDFYSEMVGRTMLRPASLPAASITIKTQSDLTRTEAMQALDSVLGLNGIAMIPVGTKFVKVVPIAQANQEAAPLNVLDSSELADLGQYITHVVQLKYSKPSELTTVLQPFAKVPNSILPIDGNQMLILRDYTENVKRMLELIEKIDVAIPSEFVSEVIPIKYALAADISSALGSIGGAGSGTTGSSGSAASRGTTGRSLAGTQNTLPGANNQGNRNYNPNNPQGNVGNTGMGGIGGGGGAAGAQTSFASRLQNIIQRASSTGSDIQLIGPNKIIADERTNSLLVFATRQDMETIKDIISKLDVVLAQVLIEAIIMDVTLGDNKDIGVSAGQRRTYYGGTNGSVSGGNYGGQLGGAISFLYNLINNTNGSSFTPVNQPQYNAQDGLKYFGSLNQQFDFTLTALAGKNDVKVLARPRIQTSHAVPASIFVGETLPYITGTYFDSYSGGGSRSQYQQTQIGISLNVLPLINPEGLVVMDIQQQVQQVGGSVKIDGNDVPITQDQNASTKVAVYNGETIVLGGFIRDQKESSDAGVPYLKDIPLLGALFRSSSSKTSRRELLVLIRPTVLNTPEIAALQPNIERARLPGIQTAIAEFQTDQIKAMKKAAKMNPADIEAEYRQAAGVTNQVPANHAPVNHAPASHAPVDHAPVEMK